MIDLHPQTFPVALIKQIIVQPHSQNPHLGMLRSTVSVCTLLFDMSSMLSVAFSRTEDNHELRPSRSLCRLHLHFRRTERASGPPVSGGAWGVLAAVTESPFRLVRPFFPSVSPHASAPEEAHWRRRETSPPCIHSGGSGAVASLP